MGYPVFAITVDVKNVNKVVKMLARKNSYIYEDWSDSEIRLSVVRYKQRIIEGILSQTYAPLYKPLSKDWLKKKKRVGWSLQFWHASGGLLKHLESLQMKRVRAGSYLISMVDGIPRTQYPNGTLSGGASKELGMYKNEAIRSLFRRAFEDTYAEFSTKFRNFKKKMED